MCVIIIKPSGVLMPTERELRAAAMANPHGFGFVTQNRYYRSTSLEEFLRELKKVKTADPCIMHFRLATHGAVREYNCHPFENNGIFFAHNGILPIVPYEGRTDSETAFDKWFMPKIIKYGYGSTSLAREVRKRIGSYSKVAFMKDGVIRKFGQFIKMNGCFYSNLRFMPYQSFIHQEKPYRVATWDEYLALRSM